MLNFTEIRSASDADITIGFYSGNHGDEEPFKGPMGVVAHAFAPTLGILHFDAAEVWVAGDALKTLRDGSKWLTDPDYVRRRQEFAHSLIQYAPVHSFVAGERVPQPEEIPVEGEDVEEDEEEAVDEEIEADSPPRSAPGAAAESAAETPASSSAPKTSDAAA